MLILKYVIFQAKRLIFTNKKLCLGLVAILLLKILFSSLLFNDSSDSDDDTEIIIELEPAHVSSNYLADYERSRNAWQNMKTAYDSLNADKKKVLADQRAKKSLAKKNYVILEYTKIMEETKYCHFFEKLDIRQAIEHTYIPECPYKNCMFTCDKKHLNRADVVLFHESDLKKDVVKEPNYHEKLMASVRDRSNQIWLLWNDEANPVNSNLDKFKFNWTMSYRHDSEVFDCSYGCFYTNTQNDKNYKREYLQKLKKEHAKRKHVALSFIR
jgi:hypothetical protein